MINIRCYKCGAKSSGDTMEQARSIMNHAVGLSRGIKCGDNYNCIEEIKDTVTTPKENDQNDSPKVDISEPSSPEPPVPETPKVEIPKPHSSETSYQKVEGKSGKHHVTFDEAKPSAKKKSKKFSY